MKHISNSISSVVKFAGKARFYNTNRDYFQRHFKEGQYDALIRAGNWAKLDEIIKENSQFSFGGWVRGRVN